MINSLVSVIIPCYNGALYIREAIDSLLAQSYNDVEIILIDDGSTDGLRETVQDLIADNHIKYLSQPNEGVSSARNNGIKNSTGKYICFLDADDVLLPNSIERRVRVLDNNPHLGLVFSNIFSEVKKGDGEVVSSKLYEDIDLIKDDDNVVTGRYDDVLLLNTNYAKYALAYSGIHPYVMGIMIKRECLDKEAIFNKTLSEDIDLWIRLFLRYDSAYIGEPLAVYKRQRSIITASRSNYYLGNIIVQQKYSHILKDNKFLRKKHRKKISRLYLALGRYYFNNQEFKDARKFLGKSLYFNMFNHRAVVFFALSFIQKIVKIVD